MIRAVVFDLDGVLYHTEKLWNFALEDDYGIPVQKTSVFFQNEFRDCSTGKKDLKAEISKYFSEWGWNKGIDFLLEYWFEYGEIDQKMLAFIQEVKAKKLPVCLCTNNEQYRMEHLTKKYGFDILFHHIFASCSIGARKPDREVFDTIIRTLKLPAQEILMIDDDPEDLEPAKEYGFQTFLYSGSHDIKAIEKFLTTG